MLSWYFQQKLVINAQVAIYSCQVKFLCHPGTKEYTRLVKSKYLKKHLALAKEIGSDKCGVTEYSIKRNWNDMPQ